MKLIKPPTPIPIGTGYFGIFLAGSIEMGAAVNWQDRVVAGLHEREAEVKRLLKINVFNPRRDDWDSSWEQSIENTQFREQVVWELSALDVADLIAVYFDPDTKSPISLLELGLHARDGDAMVVCCPDGFWRKGNVDIVCARYGIEQVADLEALVHRIVSLAMDE